MEDALIREWEEELASSCLVEKFLGVIENQWTTEGHMAL
ncbi:hypothetical protein JOC93_000968 [Priestia taiwanensis]|nr:hypothetical protein [Priestia taiwanensis]